MIEWYGFYFSGFTPYRTTVKRINIDKYRKLSDDEKRKVLRESYEAWSYEKDTSLEPPLSGLISSLARGK